MLSKDYGTLLQPSLGIHSPYIRVLCVCIYNVIISDPDAGLLVFLTLVHLYVYMLSKHKPVRGIQSYIEWIAAGACGVIAAGTSPHIAVAIVAAGCTLLIYSSHSAAPDLILVYSGAHDHSGSRNNGITVLLINQSLDSVSTCAQNGNK